MRALAWETPAGPLRRQIDRMAEVIWGTILRCAPFDAGGRAEVLHFLDKHGETYLISFDVAAVREQVRGQEVPIQSALEGNPPLLKSRSGTVLGEGNPQLADDLTERIYSAYHGLRRAGIRGARTRIAAALNAAGWKVRVHSRADAKWNSYSVYDRVKQYGENLKQRFDDRAAVTAWGDWVVDKWISAFRSQISEKRTPLPNSGTDAK